MTPTGRERSTNGIAYALFFDRPTRRGCKEVLNGRQDRRQVGAGQRQGQGRGRQAWRRQVDRDRRQDRSGQRQAQGRPRRGQGRTSRGRASRQEVGNTRKEWGELGAGKGRGQGRG